MSFIRRIEIMEKNTQKTTLQLRKSQKVLYVYSIIQRAENESGHKRAVGSGRLVVIMTKKNVKRLKTMMRHKDDVSQTQVTQKFKCSQQSNSKTLATKTTILARKKIKIPKRTGQQRAVARTKCIRLCRIFQN